MPLVFSAITPHSPLLIQSIGKENTARLKKTLESYSFLEKRIVEAEPDCIIVISPHGKVNEKSFLMNLRPDFEANLEEFGDFSVKNKYRGDYGLAYKIREKLETNSPLQLVSEEILDYASAVPLLLLAAKLPKTKIIPIRSSGLGLREHFDFGEKLQEEIYYNNEKIAVIASADLSHSLKKDSPAPYSPKAKKFDSRLTKLLAENDINGILKIKQEMIEEANECGLKPIIILEGILSKIKHNPKMLCYEAPFGVGYMTMNFGL